MMTCLSSWRQSLRQAALAMLFTATACAASAQVIPGLVARTDISMFGTLPVNVTPDFGYYAPVLFGYQLGGFLQTPHLIGVEVRGTIQRRQNAQHQESALAGPRLALHYGPISPYVSILGGAGNGWRYLNPPVSGAHNPQPVEGTGGEWMIAGGVDFHLTHHFGVRLGEISYSRNYLPNWSLSPLNFTAGVVYRIN
jgi:Outer membrane protein beta-barrel domain